jgi:hypothetical protein
VAPANIEAIFHCFHCASRFSMKSNCIAQ